MPKQKYTMRPDVNGSDSGHGSCYENEKPTMPDPWDSADGQTQSDPITAQFACADPACPGDHGKPPAGAVDELEVVQFPELTSNECWIRSI